MTHAGPENAHDNHDYRYLSAITLTWKATDKLTSITDMNYAYEESFGAKGYGIAQYLTYAISDCCTVGIRGEVWRDADGFFVARFASNNDYPLCAGRRHGFRSAHGRRRPHDLRSNHRWPHLQAPGEAVHWIDDPP
jgi:hypothetical protein